MIVFLKRCLAKVLVVSILVGDASWAMDGDSPSASIDIDLSKSTRTRFPTSAPNSSDEQGVSLQYRASAQVQVQQDPPPLIIQVITQQLSLSSNNLSSERNSPSHNPSPPSSTDCSGGNSSDDSPDPSPHITPEKQSSPIIDPTPLIGDVKLILYPQMKLEDLVTFRRSLQAMKGIDPDFLSLVNKQVIRRNFTWWQYAAAAIALRVATSVSMATTPVFSHSLDPLAPDYFAGNDVSVYFFQLSVNITQFFAATARCIPIFMRFDGPSESQYLLKKSWCNWFLDGLNKTGYGVIGLLSAVFADYLFYAAEEHAVSVNPALRSELIGYLIANAPAYFLYQIVFNADSFYLKAQKKINQWNRALYEDENPELEGDRKKVLNAFDEVGQILDQDDLDEQIIDDFYNSLLNNPLKYTPQVREEIEKTFWYLQKDQILSHEDINLLLSTGGLDRKTPEDLSEDEGRALTETERDGLIKKVIEGSETQRVTVALLEFHQKYKHLVPLQDPRREAQLLKAHRGALTLTALSFSTRWWTVASSIAKATGSSPWGALAQSLSIVGNLATSGTEYIRLNESFSRWSGMRDSHQSRTHSRCRTFTDVLSSLAGLGMNLSYIVASYFAGVDISSSVGFGLFFGGIGFSWGAEWARNAGVFGNPFQDTITAVDRLQAWRGKGPSKEHKRFRLKEVVFGIKDKYEFINHKNLEAQINAIKLANPKLVLFGDSQVNSSSSSQEKPLPSSKDRIVVHENPLAVTQSQQVVVLQQSSQDISSIMTPVRIQRDSSHFEYKQADSQTAEKKMEQENKVYQSVEKEKESHIASSKNFLSVKEPDTKETPLLKKKNSSSASSSSLNCYAFWLVALNVFYHLVWAII